jgi:hypothetical protein
LPNLAPRKLRAGVILLFYPAAGAFYWKTWNILAHFLACGGDR